MNQTSVLTYRNNDFTSIKDHIYKCISECKHPVTLVGLTEMTKYSKAQIGRRLPELLRDGLIKISGHYVMNRRHYSLYVIASESERLELIKRQFQTDYLSWLEESQKFDTIMSVDFRHALQKEFKKYI
jgi:predicted transcriptional regulator